MTTNAGPEYFVAQKKYQEATNPEQKLAGLKDMLKYAPKHKSSENLVAEITYKIAKLKKEIERQKEQQAKKGGGLSLNVKKEGAGQIAIVGSPNSGKSYLLHRLTGVDVEIAPYPFTTTMPEIGMMNFRGALVQLVEVPAIIEGSSEGKANGTQLMSLIRNADAIVLIYRSQEEKATVMKELEKGKVIVGRKKPKISIQQSTFKGLTITGKQFLKMPEKELEELLRGFGLQNASIVLEEPATMEKIKEVLDQGLEYKECLFLHTFHTFEDDHLKEIVFNLLNKIIVYTKRPGMEADLNKPLVVRKGAAITEVAELVHKEIASNLKYARVWGSTKFPGQRVAKEYELKMGDIIEVSA